MRGPGVSIRRWFLVNKEIGIQGNFTGIRKQAVLSSPVSTIHMKEKKKKKKFELARNSVDGGGNGSKERNG